MVLPGHYKTRCIHSIFRSFGLAVKSHYEVLKLRRNCTGKEIKEAFIQMSKEYHPDKNKNKNSQEHFVRIVEAYTVLSKPTSRAQYDLMSNIYKPNYPSAANVHRPQEHYYDHEHYSGRPNYQYEYFYDKSRHKAQGFAKNTNTNTSAPTLKISKHVIAVICFVLAIFAFSLQMVIIREMFMMHKKNADENSKKIAEEYEQIRAAAVDNGNAMQTKILLDKIVNAARPSVATASLGQALTSDKK